MEKTFYGYSLTDQMGNGAPDPNPVSNTLYHARQEAIEAGIKDFLSGVETDETSDKEDIKFYKEEVSRLKKELKKSDVSGDEDFQLEIITFTVK